MTLSREKIAAGIVMSAVTVGVSVFALGSLNAPIAKATTDGGKHQSIISESANSDSVGTDAQSEKSDGTADVPKDHWAHRPVVRLQEAGVVSRNAPERFRPEASVHRNEALYMLLRARGIDVGVNCQDEPADGDCRDALASTVNLAYRLAIIDPHGTGGFQADGNITREELVTYAVRTMGTWWEAQKLGWQEINRRLAPYEDQEEIAKWARPAFAWGIETGLVKGYDDGTLRPRATASRAEVATIVQRILVDENLPAVTVDGTRVRYLQQLDFRATKYATGEPGVGKIAYTGLRVRPGVVAVDPRVIPLGSLLYVEGYGYAVAGDIGGDIKGRWVDMYTEDYYEAIQWGLHQRKVWVLP